MNRNKIIPSNSIDLNESKIPRFKKSFNTTVANKTPLVVKYPFKSIYTRNNHITSNSPSQPKTPLQLTPSGKLFSPSTARSSSVSKSEKKVHKVERSKSARIEKEYDKNDKDFNSIKSSRNKNDQHSIIQSYINKSESKYLHHKDSDEDITDIMRSYRKFHSHREKSEKRKPIDDFTIDSPNLNIDSSLDSDLLDISMDDLDKTVTKPNNKYSFSNSYITKSKSEIINHTSQLDPQLSSHSDKNGIIPNYLSVHTHHINIKHDSDLDKLNSKLTKSQDTSSNDINTTSLNTTLNKKPTSSLFNTNKSSTQSNTNVNKNKSSTSSSINITSRKPPTPSNLSVQVSDTSNGRSKIPTPSHSRPGSVRSHKSYTKTPPMLTPSTSSHRSITSPSPRSLNFPNEIIIGKELEKKIIDKIEKRRNNSFKLFESKSEDIKIETPIVADTPIYKSPQKIEKEPRKEIEPYQTPNTKLPKTRKISEDIEEIFINKIEKRRNQLFETLIKLNN